MNPSIIGTSYDIRGIYPTDLDEDFYYRFGRALVSIFRFRKAAIGQDARLSSPVLADALIRGIAEGGADVVDIGICSTDMVSFATGHYDEIDFGVMVTASHNPKEYNGMKISMKNAVPVNTKAYGDQIREAMMGVSAKCELHAQNSASSFTVDATTPHFGAHFSHESHHFSETLGPV